MEIIKVRINKNSNEKILFIAIEITLETKLIDNDVMDKMSSFLILR